MSGPSGPRDLVNELIEAGDDMARRLSDAPELDLVPLPDVERWHSATRAAKARWPEGARQFEQHPRVAVLTAALEALVDTYRHPDSGRVIVEPGASDTDDALILAMAVLNQEAQRP